MITQKESLIKQGTKIFCHAQTTSFLCDIHDLEITEERPGREASAEVKNIWIYTFAPPYIFIA
jgi:hypothetical protein